MTARAGPDAGVAEQLLFGAEAEDEEHGSSLERSHRPHRRHQIATIRLPGMSNSIRAATADDIAAVEQIVALAYRPYIARIGRAPAPMTADYRALLPHTHVLIADDAVAGVLVAIPAADHLLVDNVAIDPRHRGRGSDDDCSSTPSSRPRTVACLHCGSTPTQR